MSVIDEVTYYDTKVPIFGGKKQDWPHFKIKLMSYLAQKSLIELLTWKNEIPKDNKTYTEDELKTDAVKLEIKVRDQNRKAAGILLQAITTGTSHGEAAFHIVSKFIDEEAGYAGGNFKKALETMVKRYEDRDVMSTSDLEEAYYNLKMVDDEQPDLFIVKWRKLVNVLRMKL